MTCFHPTKKFSDKERLVSHRCPNQRVKLSSLPRATDKQMDDVRLQKAHNFVNIDLKKITYTSLRVDE